TASSAATVSGRAPSSANVGASSRTGARAASGSPAGFTSSVIGFTGVFLAGAPQGAGCAQMYKRGPHAMDIAGHSDRREPKLVAITRKYTCTPADPPNPGRFGG